MIQVQNLCKNFGERRVVQDVSFEIERGEIVGFLGPNGAGKTTTMRMLTTFLSPDSGDATIDGESVRKHPLEVRRKIGYLPESAPLYPEMTIEPYLDYIGQIRGVDRTARRIRIAEMVDQCGLTDVLDREVGQLSKGYRQRVGLAATLLHDPDFVVLDEPTSGLDPNQIVEIRNLIKRIAEKKTILLSSHILPEVESTCDRVLIIAFGKVVANDTAQGLTARKQGGTVFTVGVRGPLDAAAAAFRGAPFVATVERLGAEAVGARLLLTTRADQGAVQGDKLFEFAVKNGLVLTELTARRESLEDVFAQLTRATGNSN
ncbi:MAG: ATP-binding cassette domain-containing protein [Planctomycetes bacterium]|nr:ATP-binding cassette domain-containing protein [Planctomycetota bacterium]